MKTIQLTQGKVALVDDEDFDRLRQYKWYAKRCSRNGSLWYAYRSIPVADEGPTILAMHTTVMGDAPAGMEIDHRDGDGLNNQRENVRIATHEQNQANTKPHNGRKYKGIYRDKRYAQPRYRAQIRRGGKVIYLGTFQTDIEAARAYDTKAKEMSGEFAWLNFPEDKVQ